MAVYPASSSPECTDAANDAHAGYVIYSRLITMSQHMPDPNMLSPRYYSFSVVNGSLLDYLGLSGWSPENPYYDPGPPPPPREPKIRNEGLPISPASAVNPRAGPHRRGFPRRHASAGDSRQSHSTQQSTPIVLTTVRTSGRSTAEAAGSRARGRKKGNTAEGCDGRF